MSKKKRRRPGEVPRPSKQPEISPGTAPGDPVTPGIEPEIIPEKEPGETSSPVEIPTPGKGL